MEKKTNIVSKTSKKTIIARTAWVIGLGALALTDIASAIAYIGMEETIITFATDTMPSTLA